MKPEKYIRGKALRVFWVDSTQSAGWQYHENPPVHVEEVVTLGFVVNTTNRGLNMTTSISELGGTLSMVSIPWECVIGIQSLNGWDRTDNLFDSDE